MGSSGPLGRARTDVSSMNAPLPNAVSHILRRTGSERSLHVEGGPARVCRAARLRLIYDGKSRFTPQALAALSLVVPVPKHPHFPLVQSRAIPPHYSCSETCAQSPARFLRRWIRNYSNGRLHCRGSFLYSCDALPSQPVVQASLCLKSPCPVPLP